MLDALGIAAELAPRLREFANGALAMASLARSREPLAIGCTQVTESLYTPGMRLVGALPAQFELSTTYSIALASSAVDSPAARCALRAAGARRPAGRAAARRRRLRAARASRPRPLVKPGRRLRRRPRPDQRTC